MAFENVNSNESLSGVIPVLVLFSMVIHKRVTQNCFIFNTVDSKLIVNNIIFGGYDVYRETSIPFTFQPNVPPL